LPSGESGEEERGEEMTNKDITGQRFGKLVAIAPTNKRRNRSVEWKCICDCGKEKTVSCASLVGGNSRSCGCMQRAHRKNKLPKVFEEAIEKVESVLKFKSIRSE
jgi:hypothetical protein